MEINALPEMPSEADGYLLIDNGTTYKISTSTIKGNVENNLTTTTTGSQLDARQGRLLNLAETSNEAALIALNAVIDSELAVNRSMQMMRLPAADTDNVIPSDASDMLVMVIYRASTDYYPMVYTKLFNPKLGAQTINVGGRFIYSGSHGGGTRITVNANPGGVNTIVTGSTFTGERYTRDDSYLNFFRNYTSEG